ncbi:MAG: beta strand repeat-containing protein, partial [Paracoccaceae bacterium]
DIALDNGVHDFTGTVNATGEDITLTDANAIVLGAVSTNEAGQTDGVDNDGAADATIATNRGELVVNAGGSITDAGLGTSASDGIGLLVEGATSLTARNASSTNHFDIDLDDVDNNFDQDADGDAVNAVGEDITLFDATAIVLGTVSTNEPGQTDGVGNDSAADSTISTFDDQGGGTLASAGDLVVFAGGSITDAGDRTTSGDGGILVEGRTRLDANSGNSVIVLDDADNNFDRDANDLASFTGSGGNVFHEVDARGTNITLVDSSSIALGQITASGNLVVIAGGDIRNDEVIASAGNLEQVNVGGITVFSAGGDIRTQLETLGNAVNVASANNSMVTLRQGYLRVSGASTRGDAVFAAIGSGADLVIGTELTSGGDIVLISDQGNVDFSGLTRTASSDTLLTSTGGGVAILAPNGTVGMPTFNGGSFDITTAGVDAAVFSAADAADLAQLGSSSASAASAVDTSVEIHIGQDLLVETPANGLIPDAGLLDFNVGDATTLFRLGGGATDFAVGEANMLNQVGSLAFDPINFIGTLNGDEVLMDISGNLALIVDGSTVTFNTQNTSSVIGSSNFGAGTNIGGITELTVQNGGTLLQFATFGEANGQSGVNAAVGTVIINGFTPNQNHTINGCVIGTVSSCTPLGTLALNLQFETGQFLGIVFVDPDEDEDDPFTNRGDEEEWE